MCVNPEFCDEIAHLFLKIIFNFPLFHKYVSNDWNVKIGSAVSEHSANWIGYAALSA